jgi:transcriptional regulator with XRE-family HTH domain
MEGANFSDFKADILKNKNVRKQYEILAPKYQFISKLIARRNELSLSQRELAKIIGMKQPAICRLESGDSNVTVLTLIKVIRALDLEIDLKPRVKVDVGCTIMMHPIFLIPYYSPGTEILQLRLRMTGLFRDYFFFDEFDDFASMGTGAENTFYAQLV